jgi:hypothetical protein
MKIECSGPNGETFECEWEMYLGNGTDEWQAGSKERSIFQRDAAQKALETWCDAFKVEQSKP